MSIKVFLGAEIAPLRNDPDVKSVIAGFKSYKETGNPGSMFGRDFLTLRPKDARENDLFHIHLLTEDNFQIKKLYLRDQANRTSDSFLLYCSGYSNPNYYLLIGIFWKNAHSILENDIDLLIPVKNNCGHGVKTF